jgi:hypothetical protein
MKVHTIIGMIMVAGGVWGPFLLCLHLFRKMWKKESEAPDS